MDRAQTSLATSNRAERVPESLDKRLLAYTLAAGAGLAAAPELAQASIVYTNPTDTTITNSSFIDIDLNNDAIADVRVSISTVGPFSDFVSRELNVLGNGQPTGVIGDSFNASALVTGNPISSAQSFQNIQSTDRRMAYAYASYTEGAYYSEVSGNFANLSNRFLGLRFQIGGTDYFGWARFTVIGEAGYNQGEVYANLSATRVDYAFENCAGQGIQAGATQGGASCPSGVPMPPALAMVALGAAGLALWCARRRDGQ